MRDWNKYLTDGGTDEDPKPYRDTILTKVLIPFGPLLVALITLLTSGHQIPTWAWVWIIGFLIVLLLAALAPWGQWLIKRLRRLNVTRKTASRFYSALEMTANQLNEQLSHSRSDTILAVLRTVCTWEEFRQQSTEIDCGQFEPVREWLMSEREWISDHRSDHFMRLARNLSLMLNRHNQICIAMHRRLQAVVSSMATDNSRRRQLKNDWAIAREPHVHLLRDWAAVGESINKMLGDKRCLEYFEPLRPID